MASGNQQVGHRPCKCEVGKKFFTLEVKKIIEAIKEQFPCFSKRFERVSLENASQAAKLLGLTIHCADPSPENGKPNDFQGPRNFSGI